MYKFKKWNLKYFKLKKNFQYFKFWKNKTMLHMIILILKDIAYIYIYLNTYEIEIYIILKLTKHTINPEKYNVQHFSFSQSKNRYYLNTLTVQTHFTSLFNANFKNKKQFSHLFSLFSKDREE